MKFVKTFETFNYTPNNYEYDYTEANEDDIEIAEREGHLKSMSNDLFKRLVNVVSSNSGDTETNNYKLEHDGYYSYFNYNFRKDDITGQGKINDWYFSIYLIMDDSFILSYKDEETDEIKCFHCSNYLSLIKCMKDKQDETRGIYIK